MKFRKTVAVVASVLVATAGLSACGSSRSSSGTSASGSASASGFAADATIGVALPWLGTQNWKEAQTMFTDQLKAAGYKPTVQAADNKALQQQQQIEAMIQNGAKVIIIGAVDGTQLGTALKDAKSAGVKVIAYDRAIEDPAVNALVQFGAIKTGQMQAQSLLDGLKARKGNGPYNIELFAGSPDDPNAKQFFDGAMQILQPKIDDKTLTVVSGQKSFAQCAIAGWDNQKAQQRMDSLLSGFYNGKKLDGVLSPNDGFARAIITSAKQHNQGVPVVDGLDAENDSVTSIWKGEQWSTTAKPTNKLVAQAIDIIKAMQTGSALPTPATTDTTNGANIAVYQLDPTIVTKANEKVVFKDDPVRSKLLS